MLKTITVAQLRRLLECEDDNALVIFTSDYGDYHHTEQALGIRGDIDTVLIEKSAYSNSGYALVESEDDNDAGVYEPFLLIR